MYLLLLKFHTPTDPCKVEWYTYDAVENARAHLARARQESAPYERFPRYGPVLTEWQVLKVEGVTL